MIEKEAEPMKDFVMNFASAAPKSLVTENHKLNWVIWKVGYMNEKNSSILCRVEEACDDTKYALYCDLRNHILKRFEK